MSLYNALSASEETILRPEIKKKQTEKLELKKILSILPETYLAQRGKIEKGVKRN